MSKGSKRPHEIVALTREDDAFKAVRMRRHGSEVEVLWARTQPTDGRTWKDFAVACGLPVQQGQGRRMDRTVPSVVGLDSTGVAFYRIDAPAVGQQETAAIVRMQAESRLPLPAEQIEVAWRKVPSTNGEVRITMAAARRDRLQQFAGTVRVFGPQRIILSCEAMAWAWRRLFSDGEQQAVVASLGRDNTQICLVEGDLVTHTAMLDAGLRDLASAVEAGGSVEIAERFAKDIRTILDSFGWEASAPRPLIVLSNGDGTMERISEALSQAGLPVQTVEPRASAIRLPAGLGARDLYDFRACLGLGLIALEAPSPSLDLFERIRADDDLRETRSAKRSVTVAGLVAAVMLVVLLVVWRSVDVATAARLGRQVADPNFQAVKERQALLKTVARHRPDVLQLLTDIHAGPTDGIVLDNLHFKKGQTVTISGRADKIEQMWQFQTGLIDQTGIKEVEITSQTADAKTKKIKFAMTFHYKGLTKKEAAL